MNPGLYLVMCVLMAAGPVALGLTMGRMIVSLRNRIETLEHNSHPPFDFTELVTRLQRCEYVCGVIDYPKCPDCGGPEYIHALPGGMYPGTFMHKCRQALSDHHGQRLRKSDGSEVDRIAFEQARELSKSNARLIRGCNGS